MTAFHPRAEDLPNEFAVFPLPGALLMPRGKLPLRISDRYPFGSGLTAQAAGKDG